MDNYVEIYNAFEFQNVNVIQIFLIFLIKINLFKFSFN
jgi:hypothetical protein